jgi:hypothetical protein
MPASKLQEYLKAFLRKYPTANKHAHFTITLVDPQEWYVSDDQSTKVTFGHDVSFLLSTLGCQNSLLFNIRKIKLVSAAFNSLILYSS